jgi:threonine/homoserine/homoserine lactone efflux protein
LNSDVFQAPEARAFAFGILLAGAVGPIALLIATNSLRFGLVSGIQSAVGAALGDLTYAVVAAIAGVSITTALVAHTQQIHLAGSAALVLFGTYIVIQASRSGMAAEAHGGAPMSSRPLPATYLLTLVNPITTVVFAGFIAQLPTSLSASRLCLVVASLFMGSLVVQLGIAIGAGLVGKRLNEGGSVRNLNVLSGVGLIGFGLFGFL